MIVPYYRKSGRNVDNTTYVQRAHGNMFVLTL